MSKHPRTIGLTLIFASITLLMGCSYPNYVHINHARKAMKSQDWVTAQRHLDIAMSQDSTDWEVQYFLGRVKLKQSEFLDAQLLFERAVTLRFDHRETADIYDGLAASVYAQQKTKQLREILDRATTEYGGTRDYARKAKFLAKIGDPDGAELALRTASRIANAKDPVPFIAAADFYEALGKRQETVTNLRRAYYLMPDDELLQDRLRKFGVEPGPNAGIKP